MTQSIKTKQKTLNYAYFSLSGSSYKKRNLAENGLICKMDESDNERKSLAFFLLTKFVIRKGNFKQPTCQAVKNSN
ncbi:MAG: hypothetical protein DI539_30520 [Flavobacterium psychrophilum]|nr:MAG: hypothetical protein DI539_30520 [Flavobacterium psychrophilum]